MIPILITGGAGYIGSHSAKILAQSGYYPVVFDNFSFGHRWAVNWGPFVEGDLNNSELVKSTIKKYSIEAVIHFAANAYVGESVANPLKYFNNNVANTINLLNAMNDTGVKNIVFSSTCAVYGVPVSVPIAEDHPTDPISPYGDSKLFVERMLKRVGNAYNFQWACLRYFNASGADPEGEIGESHDPETHLIPLILYSILGKIPRVYVYGTDYDTPDGTPIRDYIHVLDLARAHVQALEQIMSGSENFVCNLGTGNGHSVREVINCTEKITGKSVPYQEVARRNGDPPVLFADSSKARKLLDWEPVYDDLESIIETAWNWHLKNDKI